MRSYLNCAVYIFQPVYNVRNPRKLLPDGVWQRDTGCRVSKCYKHLFFATSIEFSYVFSVLIV